MVTSLGDVYLIDEDEDGNTQEYLLDTNEIQGAEWRRTALVTVPMWAWRTLMTKLGLQKKAVDVGPLKNADSDEGHDSTNEAEAIDENAIAERLKKKGVKKRTRGVGRK